MTTHTLTLTARHVSQLRDHLLRDDGLERAAYAYCSRSGDNRLLAEEIILITDDQLSSQSPTACRPDDAVERELLSTCSQRNMHPLILHSHPFDHGDEPWFSTADDDLMNGLQEMITGLYPDTEAMFGVLNQNGLIATRYNPETGDREPLPVTVIGNHKLEVPLTTPDSEYSDTGEEAIDQERHDRGIRAIGETGQQRLSNTHIAVIGAGGLGSVIADELASKGVGTLTIIDPDHVEESNLPRIRGAYDYHIGRPKVEAVKHHLWKTAPGIDVTPLQDHVEHAEDALKQADLIIAGVDTVSARMWLNQFAVRHLIPYIDAGVVIETTDTDTDADAETGGEQRIDVMEGYIQFIQPGANACYDCLDRGDPEWARIEQLSDEELDEEIKRGYIAETDLSPAPAVVSLNGEAASKAVALAVKHLTGYGSPADFLWFETIAYDLEVHKTRPSDGCTTCGPHGILGRGDREPTAADLADDTQELDLDTDLSFDTDETETEDPADHEEGEPPPDTEDALEPGETDLFGAFTDTDTDRP